MLESFLRGYLALGHQLGHIGVVDSYLPQLALMPAVQPAVAYVGDIGPAVAGQIDRN